MNNSGLQKLGELGYSGIADEIAKSLQCWYDGLKSRRTSLVEDYIEGKLDIHAHISVRVRRQDGPSRKNCILYKIGRRDIEDLEATSTGWRSHGDTLAAFLQVEWQDSRKMTVLVAAMEMVDLPEGMRSVITPLTVRLKRLDDSLGVECDASDAIVPLIRVGLLEYRELRPSNLFVGQIGVIFHGECEGQMIERGPQIENAVTSDNIKNCRNFADSGDSAPAGEVSFFERLLRHFRVRFIDNAVGVSLDPLCGLHLEAI
ncbi:MAG: hypothetical protein SH868_04275 [Bythopirellula sp.]|nr:hypothetical protein [Bythopirellula sp.]